MKSAINSLRLTAAATFLVMALVPCALARGTDDGERRRADKTRRGAVHGRVLTKRNR